MSRFTVKAIRALCAALFLVALGSGAAAGTGTTAHTAGGGQATTNDVWCC
ncbi:hypothetical protein F4553_007491 [Allocatelliglobosispora scoriae]|uniref:Uncharacterized protein n=1 Tax=Allocatelliglobosispora scoriae TaxID=643052 RepID=A0A841BY23_9ACTN|nr:hypothetical protein [Allocatelliglobosispora scoriae]MBB5874057.1 hypothetical protein [Allocatelliglobosispora scoriae]